MVTGGAEVFRTTAAGTETLIHVNDGGAKPLREQDVIHGSPILNARFFRRGCSSESGPSTLAGLGAPISTCSCACWT